LKVIAAEGVVPAPPEKVFAFLSDLENHWQLADRFVEVVALDRDSQNGPARGGRVRMHGPLGLKRTATTLVVHAQPNETMRGTAELGQGTQAQIEWRFTPDGGGTRVRLAAAVERANLLDRVLLQTGGSTWLRRRFAKILGALASRLSEGEPPRNRSKV
jgi:uncharacterized protein YndB with AHSA1/START domain